MLNKLKIYRPISTNIISQTFGIKGTKPSMLSAYHKFGLTAHNGWDFSVNYQTLYWSVNVKGIVYKISEDSKGGIGLDIISLSEEGYYKHRFWHLKKESIIVKEGDVVETGQALATTGNTGFSTGPHLHYGLKPVYKNLDGSFSNIFQTNGYWGAVDLKPFYRRGFILDVMNNLTKQVTIYKKIIGLINDFLKVNK